MAVFDVERRLLATSRMHGQVFAGEEMGKRAASGESPKEARAIAAKSRPPPKMSGEKGAAVKRHRGVAIRTKSW